MTTILDATGLLCPLPVLKLRKRLQDVAAGDHISMRADDPAAFVDVPHFCNESGHTLVSSETNGDATIYLVRKKG